MRIIDCEQGSDEWLKHRAGKVTASRVADIIRKTKTGISASRNTYLGELVAERLSGQPTPTFKSKPMEWGSETEAEARAFYAFMNDVDPVRVGLVLHPAIEMAAASPDSLVAEDGMIEIKCPNSATHIRTLLGAEIEPDYLTQIQWQFACTGRKWCDFISYDPRMSEDMRMHTVRIHRDLDRITELEREVVKFLYEVDNTISKLLAKYRPLVAA